MSAIGTTEASAITHEWQTDSLAAAATNAQLEGDDVTFPAVVPTVRVSNTCQILSKQVIVSGTQDAISKAGRRSELAYQLSMRSKEHARDLEYALLNNASAVSGNATTARQMKGVPGWITTNTTAKAAADISEDDIDSTCSDIWTEGGEPNLALVGAHNKRTISAFTTGVTKNIDAEDKRLTRNIDVYESDFGVLQIVPDHFNPAATVNILDTELWAVAYLRRHQVNKLAKTGDASKRHMLCECTLQSKQEKGNGNLTGTSTS